MTAFVILIAVALIIASLHSLSQWAFTAHSSFDTGNSMEKSNHKTFLIRWDEHRYAPAIIVKPDDNPHDVIKAFGISTPRPTISITGGAGAMSEADVQRTRDIIEAVAAFAEKHDCTLVDGGTEAGVMQMIGEARKKLNFKFPLIGVAPHNKVSYPMHESTTSEAELEDGHSHFVLVDADDWGDESKMLVGITRSIANGQRPKVGILINGGKIAERETYLASADGDAANRIPVLVLNGSGRTATRISNALKTGQADTWMVQAIIRSKNVQIAELEDGPGGMLDKLYAHFKFPR